MFREIFFEYIDPETGQLGTPYNVSLADKRGVFGVKRDDTGAVVYPAGTSVENPAKGIYSFGFEVLNDITYTISWRVQPNQNAQFQYSMEQFGPFHTDTSISATPDFKGTFRQGERVSFVLTLLDAQSRPYQAESIGLKLLDVNNNEVFSSTPSYNVSGFYEYDYNIPLQLYPGNYAAIWVFVVDGVVHERSQVIDLAELPSAYTLEFARIQRLRTTMRNYLRPAFQVPVYFEQGSPLTDLKTYQFGFPRWNNNNRIKIYRNKILLNSGYKINYDTGEVYFNSPNLPQDMVHADYNFRWFEDAQLDDFILNAVNIYNHTTPFSYYSLGSLPVPVEAGIIMKANVDAIRELIAELMFQEAQLVFGGPEEAKAARADWETLKKNYEGEWKWFYEQKKLGPYPKTMAISVPEYTLPGGRSRWFRNMFSTNI